MEKEKRFHIRETSGKAGVVRVELTLTVLETAVLPLNYTPKNLPDYISTADIICQ